MGSVILDTRGVVCDNVHVFNDLNEIEHIFANKFGIRK